jgi:hypothetical protein
VGAFSGGQTAETPAEMQQKHQQDSANTVTAIVFYSISAALLATGIIFTNIHPSGSLTTSSGQRLVKLAVPLTKKLTLTPAGLVF